MFKVSKYKNIRGLNMFIGKYLKKTQSELLIENGFDIKKCAFCDNNSFVKIDWKIQKDEYVISGVLYPNGYYCKQQSCEGKKINPQSKEWLSKVKGLNSAQINEYLVNKSRQGVKTLNDSGWYEDISNNPFSKEFWIKKGFTEDEAQTKVNERNRFHPLFWELRGYSKEESKKYAKESSKTNSLKYYKEKYGNEEGKLRWAQRKERWKTVYDVERISERYNVDISEAHEIKEKIIKGWVNNFSQAKYSKSSYLFFKSIYEKLPDELKKKCYFGDDEFGRYDRITKKYYFYDFVISSLNLCIEYNGIKFHPKYKDENWKQLFTSKTYEEVINHDLNKRNLLESEGWTYHTVWEDEIKDETLNDIYKLIIKKYYERVQTT